MNPLSKQVSIQIPTHEEIQTFVLDIQMLGNFVKIRLEWAVLIWARSEDTTLFWSHFFCVRWKENEEFVGIFFFLNTQHPSCFPNQASVVLF